MKKLLLAAIFFGTFLNNAYANSCNYEEIKSNEYKLTESSKKYVLLHFFIDPNKDRFASGQRSERKYAALRENNFKVLETGLTTKAHDSFKRLKQFNTDVEISGKAYTLDKSLTTKLITSTCDVFYVNLDQPYDEKYWSSIYLKADGSPIKTEGLLEIIGKSLQPKDTSANVTYDRFEKVVNIKTNEFNNMLLRGAYSPSSKKNLFVQLYLDATFLGDWGGIKLAYDTSGVAHEVVLISHNADCSNRYLGCKLEETLGVTLSEDFLKKNKNGFELKLKGKQDKIISVSSDLVKSFLDGLDQAKREYK
ncbi:hypothetical protein C8322_13775 [Acinetobacter sp. SM1B]|uniref:hypothetical protein n=1 Tax=Acinetobacter sp. SM1B TaxID=1497337 RepID=UPI000DCD8B56|nr:hypothetical protein [Acinetobacter sp. SM1B]RAZ02969.1 hypothetical protein C8322_13775 [Acinetobacter sp. SM1B]